MNGLKFDEAAHRYSLDGRDLAGVTTVLAPLIDFSMVKPEILAAGQSLGTAVHKATELHDTGDLDTDSMSPTLLPYLEAWQRFRVECDFHPLTIEKRMALPALGFAGTSDRTGLIRGKKAVLDIKKMMTLGPVIGLQLAAYMRLHNHYGDGITHRFALGLRPDGTYRLQEYTAPNDWPTFLSLLNIHQWRKQNGY